MKFKLATTETGVIEAWKIVYDQYLATSLINPNESCIFTFPQYIGNHTAVILGQKDGRTLCTISGLQDSEMGLPLDNNFNRHLNKLRREKKKLIEIGLLAAVKEDQRNFYHIVSLMVNVARFGVQQGHYDFVIGVHPRRAQFYKKVFDFNPIADSVEYDKMNDAPVVLMHVDSQSESAQALPAWKSVYNHKGDLNFSQRHLFNPHNFPSVEFGLVNYTFNRRMLEHAIVERRKVFKPAPILISRAH